MILVGELFTLKHLPFSLLVKLRDLPQVKSAFLFGDSLHLRLNPNMDFIAESNADLDVESSTKSSAILESFLQGKLGCDVLGITRINTNIEDCGVCKYKKLAPS